MFCLVIQPRRKCVNIDSMQNYRSLIICVVRIPSASMELYVNAQLVLNQLRTARVLCLSLREPMVCCLCVLGNDLEH